MLVLAVDTATPAVTAGVVALDDARPPRVLGQRVTVDARAHGELLTPHILAALDQADATLADLDALVCGVGPGPFTGLRAGMVTAAAFGHALDLPVYPVCTLDAIARAVPAEGGLLVATDARRKEVYWAGYRGTVRIVGPEVGAPAEVASRLAEPPLTVAAGAGARSYADVFGLAVIGADYPEPAGLVAVAAGPLLAGTAPDPLVPLYLRRPDAVPPGERKRVSRP